MSSKGFIVGAGGEREPFAVIGVTYPQGSTCTCTNGTKVLKAKGTGGSFPFRIPSEGTWTVSCTDGSHTVSRSVNIEEQYQYETVTLVYRRYLYNAGDKCTDVTGDYTYDAAGGTITWGAESFTIAQAGIYISAVITNNTIGMDDFTMLYVEVSSGAVTGRGYFSILIVDSAGQTEAGVVKAAGQLSAGTIAIPIGDIQSGKVKITAQGAWSQGASDGYAGATITQIYMT